jgi:hypothetical protein
VFRSFAIPLFACPTGYWNGELAITPDLIRNAEGLRQGVIELRQIMESLRGHGCREFGVLATSYGGWIGALLTLVESDFRFVALMSPIVNIEHAIWHNRKRGVSGANWPRQTRPRSGCAAFFIELALHGRPMFDPRGILSSPGNSIRLLHLRKIEAITKMASARELVSRATKYISAIA